MIEYFPKLYKPPLKCVIQIYNKRQTQNSFLSLLIIRKPYASFFLDAFCVFLAQIFPGNGDSETAVFNILKPPITARYIRISPIAWYKNIAMRIEIYGCTGNVLIVTNDANKKSNRGAFLQAFFASRYDVSRTVRFQYGRKIHSFTNSLTLFSDLLDNHLLPPRIKLTFVPNIMLLSSVQIPRG